MASFASTGDLQNNLHKLASLLRRIKYPLPPDPYSLSKGDPAALLPILHHILLDRSPQLARHFAARGHTLSGKTDARFVDGVYRLLRDEFAFRPTVNKAQFLATGFAERKCIFVHEIVRLCDELERDLKRRLGHGENATSRPQSAAAAAAKAVGLPNGQNAVRPTATTTAKVPTQQRKRMLVRTGPAPLAAATAAAAAIPPPRDSSPPRVQTILPNNVAVVSTVNESTSQSTQFRMSTHSSARSFAHRSPSPVSHRTDHDNDNNKDGPCATNADLSWTRSSDAASSSSSPPRSRQAFGASMLCEDHDTTVARVPTGAANGGGEGYTIYEPRKDPPRPPAQMPPELLANPNNNQHHDEDNVSMSAMSFLTTSDVLRSTPRPPHENPHATAVVQQETVTTTSQSGASLSSLPPFQFLSRTWVAPTAPPANSTPVPPNPIAANSVNPQIPVAANPHLLQPPPPPPPVAFHLQTQDAMQPIFENFMRLFAAKEQVTSKCCFVPETDAQGRRVS
ncbi:Centrosomal protein of 44 kDa [Geranomyces michiganensis]|nr:Centrosomal protein of 44 kDa [Geranomyces michiganensis]